MSLSKVQNDGRFKNRDSLCGLCAIIHALIESKFTLTQEEIDTMYQKAEELRGHENNKMLNDDNLIKILTTIERFSHLAIALVDRDGTLVTINSNNGVHDINNIIVIMVNINSHPALSREKVHGSHFEAVSKNDLARLRESIWSNRLLHDTSQSAYDRDIRRAMEASKGHIHEDEDDHTIRQAIEDSRKFTTAGPTGRLQGRQEESAFCQAIKDSLITHEEDHAIRQAIEESRKFTTAAPTGQLQGCQEESAFCQAIKDSLITHEEDHAIRQAIEESQKSATADPTSRLRDALIKANIGDVEYFINKINGPKYDIDVIISILHLWRFKMPIFTQNK
jgi:hypothetical protein